MPFFVTPEGVRLYYQTAGKGKPILFLHGWAMCSRVWDYQVRCYSGDFQVVTLDLRGHGRSGTLDGRCNLTSLSVDIAHFVKGLGLQNLTIIGWSLAVSLILKICTLHHLPIDSVVLVDGTPSFVARDDFPHGLPPVAVRRMLRQVEENYQRALGTFHNLLLSEKEEGMENKDEIWDLLTNERYLPMQETARELLLSLAWEDLREKIKGINFPTLIMHGEQDKICLAGAAEYMAEHIDSAKVVVFPEAGHAPFLTQADTFNQKLKTFLHSL